MASLAQAVALEHQVHGRIGRFDRRCYNHPFTGSETVCLDDDRHPVFADVALRRIDVGKSLESCRGNPVPLHKLLGEVFRRFQLRRSLRRTENFQTGSAENIDQAGSQGALGPYDGKGNLLVSRKLDEIVEGAQGDIGEAIFPSRARIAGRYKHLRDTRRLGDSPGERMFPATRADDEDFHAGYGLGV